MNRVLSWPQTPLVPDLIKSLRTGRWETSVSERGTVRIELPLGPVEMSFLAKDHKLEPGTRVYAWWKGGGFVCAPVAEIRAEEHHSRVIADRMNAARARLQAARRERAVRDSSLTELDALPPMPPPADHTPLPSGR